VLQVGDLKDDVVALINEIKKQLEDNISPGEVIRLEKRLARLSAKVAIVKVGANSEVELKEKADRVEDAICATKAAIKEGIVPGGGIALLNASNILKDTIESNEELVLLDAIRAPFLTILANAGIDELPPDFNMFKEGYGLDVITGDVVNMIDSGIIDPLLVTNSALKNASSVATTILSTDCVINNLRVNEGNR
jgi:chaperonin GroEL